VSLCLVAFPVGFLSPHQGRHQATHLLITAAICRPLVASPRPGSTKFKKARSSACQRLHVVEDLGYTDTPGMPNSPPRKSFCHRQKRTPAMKGWSAGKSIKSRAALDQTIRLTGPKPRNAPFPYAASPTGTPPPAGAMSFSPTISSWRPRPSPTSTRNAGRSRSLPLHQADLKPGSSATRKTPC